MISVNGVGAQQRGKAHKSRLRNLSAIVPWFVGIYSVIRIFLFFMLVLLGDLFVKLQHIGGTVFPVVFLSLFISHVVALPAAPFA